MAVLCEAYSIVVRRDAIDKYFNDGWSGFLEKIPNGTMCSDGELVRVGFMDPALANEYLHLLLSKGLRFDTGRDDLAIVDQNKGPINDCKWVQFLKTKINDTDHDVSLKSRIMKFAKQFLKIKTGHDVSMCWLWEGHKPTEGIILRETSMKLATPKDWKPGKMQHGVGTDHVEFLRSEDGMDVYWDAEKKKEVFTTKKNKHSEELSKENQNEELLRPLFILLTIIWIGSSFALWMELSINYEYQNIPVNEFESENLLGKLYHISMELPPIIGTALSAFITSPIYFIMLYLLDSIWTHLFIRYNKNK